MSRIGEESGVETAMSKEARILKERAVVLARIPKREETGNTLDIIEFRIAGERYAIESIHVREVFPLQDITPLPGTPDFILGIINVRGQILSVMDLKIFFELPQTGLLDSDRVIILRHSPMEFGIVAETILGSRRLSKRDIQPALPTMTGLREAFVFGVTNEHCVVLDGKAILENERVKVEEAS